jgi:hypothetical protein
MVGYALQVHFEQPFAGYMKQQVFTPLGMASATFDLREAWRSSSIAKGNPTAGAGILPYIPMVPSGGMYASVKDLARCVAMHLQGGKVNGRQFVDPELLKEMYTPQFAVPGQKGGYGLGTQIEVWHGVMAYSHAGAGFGYFAVMKWVPAYGVGVLILSNANSNDDQARANINWLAYRALELEEQAKTGATPVQPAPRDIDKPSVSLDVRSLKNLEGTYMARSYAVKFEVQDGGLYVQRVGGKARKLKADSPTRFFVASGDDTTTWTFQLDSAGKPKGVLSLGDSDYSTEFLPLNDQPNEKPGPARAEWKAWTGTYATTIVGALWQPQSGGYAPGVAGPEIKLAVSMRNGYLYLTFLGEESDAPAKLTEWKHGLFFTSVGDTVEFQSDRIVVGNVAFVRD